MKVRRGDIVLVDFPYSDRTGSKVRPALVVQADVQLDIDITAEHGPQTGLRLPSVVQCENLITYDQALIVRTLGRLPSAAAQQIDACLKAALGIP